MFPLSVDYFPCFSFMILITLHMILLSLHAIKKPDSLYEKRGAWYSDHGTPFFRVNAVLCSRKTIKKYISRQGGLNLFGQESRWANKKILIGESWGVGQKRESVI
jgi:hypothetical protein